MRKISIIGNWKMNPALSSMDILTYDIIQASEEPSRSNIKHIVICPPSISLDRVAQAASGSHVKVGAQNVHSEDYGAFTGEISAPMVADLADFVILGHSERRILFGESDAFVNKKVVAALKSGLKPILCVGESFEQRKTGRAEEVVNSQLLGCLEGVSDISDLLVAYEPVWAIGSGEAASPQIAQQMMAAIRLALKTRFGADAESVPCLYGGSVNADNIQDFVRQPDIDGALVGGASLSADSFAAIIARASEVVR